MRAASVEKLVWVLVYGGLLSASLGAFMRRSGAFAGLVLVAGGAASVVIGAVLVLVRARMPTPVKRDAPSPPFSPPTAASPSSSSPSAPDSLP